MSEQHWLETERSDREAGIRAIKRAAVLENDLEHALVTVGAFRQAIEDIFAKAEGSATDDGTIRFYTMPTGPLHRAIGLARGTDAGGKFLAEMNASRAALARAEQANGELRTILRAAHHRRDSSGDLCWCTVNYGDYHEPICREVRGLLAASSQPEAGAAVDA